MVALLQAEVQFTVTQVAPCTVTSHAPHCITVQVVQTVKDGTLASVGIVIVIALAEVVYIFSPLYASVYAVQVEVNVLFGIFASCINQEESCAFPYRVLVLPLASL